MWLLKYVSTILLLCSHYPRVLASRIHSVSGKGNVDKANHVAALALNHVNTENVQEGSSQTHGLTTGDNYQESSSATELEQMISSGSARRPPPDPMFGTAKFRYMSTCTADIVDILNFTLTARYVGNHVHFEGHQNVDGFGESTMDRGRGNSLISSAPFYHSVCRTVTPVMVCDFQYSGWVTATVIPSGTDRSLVLNPETELSKPKLRPMVKQACVLHPAKVNIGCWNTHLLRSKLTPSPCDFGKVQIDNP